VSFPTESYTTRTFCRGDLLQPLNDALFTIVNHLPGAGLQRAALLRADGADQFRAQRFRPLAGDQPDATRRGMKQELLVGLNFIGFAQQVVDRQPFQERGRRLFKEMASGSRAALSAGTLWTEL
jgi:hypothetical protein